LRRSGQLGHQSKDLEILGIDLSQENFSFSFVVNDKSHADWMLRRRQASRRRSAVDKVVLKSVNTLVEMWRRIFKARK
jgi:hypothetical protein